MSKLTLPFDLEISDIGLNPLGEISIVIKIRYHQTGFERKLQTDEIYINISKEIKRSFN